MRFLQGIRIAALPEGKRLLAETQWILGVADRGQNDYSRPDYTELSSIFATLFDTDVASVKGYKELFDMKATTKAGTVRNLKYLVISFKDSSTGQWKILGSLDNADDETSIDIDHQVSYFKSNLSDAKYSSPRESYAVYGDWLLRSGRIVEAKAALETAKTASPKSGIDAFTKREGDPVRDIQIDTLLTIIGKIVPQAISGK